MDLAEKTGLFRVKSPTTWTLVEVKRWVAGDTLCCLSIFLKTAKSLHFSI